MHHPDRLVGAEAWVGICHLVAEPLFTVRDTVGKDHADGLVQVMAPLGRAADVQVDQVAQGWAVFAWDRTVFRGGALGFDDGSGRVAPLPDEGLGAGLHARQVVGYKEKLDSGFVWVLDDDLELPLFWNAVPPARGRLGQSGGSLGPRSLWAIVTLLGWTLVRRQGLLRNPLEILVSRLQLPFGPLPLFGIGQSVL